MIGVAPPAFHGSQTGLEFNLWIPTTMYGQVTHTGTWMLRDRNTRNFMVLGRLRPDITVQQARSEAQALAGRLAAMYCQDEPGSRRRREADLEGPFHAAIGYSGPYSDPDVRERSPAADRLRERRKHAVGARNGQAAGIQCPLGAWRRSDEARPATPDRDTDPGNRWAVAGVVIAFWLGSALRWLLPKVASPAVLQPGIDWAVLLFTSVTALAVTILAGAGPALTAARSNVNEILKQAGRSGAGLQSHWLRGPLVISEVALAVVAIIGAGLFLKSFRQTREISPGFEPKDLVMARFDLASAGFNAQGADAFCRRLREALERSPGVTAVSYEDTPPLGFFGGNWEPLEVEGYVPGPNENMKIERDLVSSGYFSLMKIPLIGGRDFDLRDTATRLHDDPDHQKVMIVNQEFARRFFANRDPIGRKVRGWGEWFTVVGVVANIKYHQVTEGPRPYFYAPIRQIYRPEYGLTFNVRTSGPEAGAIAAIRREAAAIDPAMMIADSMPMTEYVAASMYGPKIGAVLLKRTRRARIADGGAGAVQRNDVLGGAADGGDRNPRDARRGAAGADDAGAPAWLGLSVGGPHRRSLGGRGAGESRCVSAGFGEPDGPGRVCGSRGVYLPDCAAVFGAACMAGPASRSGNRAAMPVDAQRLMAGADRPCVFGRMKGLHQASERCAVEARGEAEQPEKDLRCHERIA